jgi:hypothetical protein
VTAPAHPNACAALARTADDLAVAHTDPHDFLVQLGHRAAGIPRGRTALLHLVLGGRNRLPGGGFRPELRDHTAGQARHFAGTARAVTALGAERTRWLSVHVRRDAPGTPDGLLTELGVEFAQALLDGSLAPADAGAWIRRHVCGGGTG